MEFSFAFMCASFGFCFGMIVMRAIYALGEKRAEDERAQREMNLLLAEILQELQEKKEG